MLPLHGTAEGHLGQAEDGIHPLLVESAARKAGVWETFMDKVIK